MNMHAWKSDGCSFRAHLSSSRYFFSVSRYHVRATTQLVAVLTLLVFGVASCSKNGNQQGGEAKRTVLTSDTAAVANPIITVTVGSFRLFDDKDRVPIAMHENGDLVDDTVVVAHVSAAGEVRARSGRLIAKYDGEILALLNASGAIQERVKVSDKGAIRWASGDSLYWTQDGFAHSELFATSGGLRIQPNDAKLLTAASIALVLHTTLDDIEIQRDTSISKKLFKKK